ncbi:MAG: GxxExxY protein [Gemmatimonadales bacterium]|nr:GxxExxY protein [Gemmatimonadales bacterium]MDZ4259052.1 GxxExxY protein [Gemmatimonadales bacterium]MDZ4390911.1 GxxExxY protein [Gemmatimonadales bacterium]
MRDINQLSGEIVDCAFRLHVGLGPGLLESVYQRVLTAMLRRRGLEVATELPVSFDYEGMRFENGLRLDMMVDGLIIVELKSVEYLAPVHRKQLITYLRLTNCRLGLLLNFGSPTMKEGIHRIVNNL